MTLNELSNYVQNYSQRDNIWNNVMHDWMVVNVDQMALSIREFIQDNYTSTYSSMGDNIDFYRALAFMGLDKSVFYNEKVVQAGKESLYEKYIGLFCINTSGCNN